MQEEGIAQLSDEDLDAALLRLARTERDATVALVEHLAELQRGACTWPIASGRSSNIAGSGSAFRKARRTAASSRREQCAGFPTF
jgi:hypothetical protein